MVQAQHNVWAVELPGWLEVCAIELQSLHHVRGREMRGKCEGQAEFGSKLRAKET